MSDEKSSRHSPRAEYLEIPMNNINDFLAFDKIVAVGGSFMMKGDIVANCKKLMEVIKK